MNLVPVQAEAPDQHPSGGDERRRGEVRSVLATALVWWVERVRRLAGAIVIAAVLAALAGGVYTARHLRMNSDSDALLSTELPYRKTLKAFRAAFPQIQGNLVVLVEGDSPDRAEDAANALVARLGENDKVFEKVYFPTGEPFFRREGLLFLDNKELQELSDRLAQAQPLLGTLVEDRSLR
ncbi:MAG: hypothetical protein ACHQF3_08220, partial [Alphaproteobacteria bacterium]